MVIDSAMRSAIDEKMNAAVEWASNGSREDGLPLLTSDSVKRVFLAPAWSNRGGRDVRQPGLRVLLSRHYDDPVDIAWSWLYHSRGHSLTGDFQRYSRGGDRSTPVADWQGRARRLVQWDRPFDSCDCSNCHGGALYSSPRAERLLELKSNILSLLLVWSSTLIHGVWLTADGVVRLGYGSRAALWTTFGSEFRIFNGARTFQALLTWLAEEGHIIGDLDSKKLKAYRTPDPATRVRRPLKRPRSSILLDVFSGFQSLAYLAATLSLTYVSVDISAVLIAGTSTFSATLVQDLSLLPYGRIIQCILEVLGISAGCYCLHLVLSPVSHLQWLRCCQCHCHREASRALQLSRAWQRLPRAPSQIQLVQGTTLTGLWLSCTTDLSSASSRPYSLAVHDGLLRTLPPPLRDARIWNVPESQPSFTTVLSSDPSSTSLRIFGTVRLRRWSFVVSLVPHDVAARPLPVPVDT